MKEPKLVTVFTSQGMLPAEVVKGKLESFGIPVLLRYEAVGQILGLTVDGLGRVDVQVPEEFAEEALALVEEEEPDDDMDEDRQRG